MKALMNFAHREAYQVDSPVPMMEESPCIEGYNPESFHQFFSMARRTFTDRDIRPEAVSDYYRLLSKEWERLYSEYAMQLKASVENGSITDTDFQNAQQMLHHYCVPPLRYFESNMDERTAYLKNLADELQEIATHTEAKGNLLK